MVLSTQISRVSDGLPLAQSVDDSSTETALSEYKQQAKLLLRRITPTSAATCTIDSGPSYSLHYLISPPPNSAGNLNSTSVVFLTIAQRSYPRKLAFAYLEELAKEFVTNYGTQISQRNLRPYAFVGFGGYQEVALLQQRCSDFYLVGRYIHAEDKAALCRYPDSGDSGRSTAGSECSSGRGSRRDKG